MSVVGDRVEGTIQSSRRARPYRRPSRLDEHSDADAGGATVTDPGDGTTQGLFSVHLDGIGTPILDKAYGSGVSFWRDICVRGPG
jgi:hypothetical protein